MPQLPEWWKNDLLQPFMGAGSKPVQGQQPTQQPPPQPGGRYGFTGNGVDGIPQPQKRVPQAGNGQYDAHESEFVFDANSTQAIGADVLEGMRQAAQGGKVNVNALRQAIGMQPKQGFQTGGVVGPAAKPIGSKTENADGTITVSGGKPIVGPSPAVIGGPDNPIDTTKLGIQNKANTSKEAETGSAYDDREKTGLDLIEGIATGDSRYFDLQRKNLEQDLAGIGAASTASAKQQAAQAGLSQEAIAGIGNQAQRDQISRTSRTLGSLSEAQAGQAAGAAQSLVSASQWGKQFEEDKARYADREEWKGYEEAVRAGDYETASEAYKELTGNELSTEHFEKLQEYQYGKMDQDLIAGELSNLASELGIEQIKDETQWAAYARAVQAGDFDEAAAAYKEATGRDLDTTQFETTQDRLNKMGDLEVESAELTIESLRQKLDDQEYSSIYTKISTGATLDQVKSDLMASGLSESEAEAAYDSMREEYGLGLEADKLSLDQIRNSYESEIEDEANEELYGWLGEAAGTEAGYDWRNDDEAKKRFQEAWEAEGHEGEFTESWADRKAKIAQWGQVEKTVTSLQNQPWFQDLQETNPEKAGQIVAAQYAIGELRLTNGMNPIADDDGAIIGWRDSQGKLVHGTDKDGNTPDSEALNEAVVAGKAPGDFWEQEDGSLVTKTDAGNVEPVSVDVTKTDQLYGDDADSILEKSPDSTLGKSILDSRVADFKAGNNLDKIGTSGPVYDALRDQAIDKTSLSRHKVVRKGKGDFWRLGGIPTGGKTFLNLNGRLVWVGQNKYNADLGPWNVDSEIYPLTDYSTDPPKTYYIDSQYPGKVYGSEKDAKKKHGKGGTSIADAFPTA